MKAHLHFSRHLAPGFCGALALMLQSAQVTAQQDIQFSQYVFTGLVVNPAYAGYREDLNVSAIYRQQWAGFPGAPRTTAVTIDGLTKVSEDRMGLGLEIMDDKLGPQENTQLFGSYSYRIPLDPTGERRLCLGIAFGFTQYSINGSQLQYVDANDPSIPLVDVHSIYPDGQFGIYYYTPHFYAAASALGLFSVINNRQIFIGNSIQYASILESPHLYITAGGLIDVSDAVKIKPSFMWQEEFQGPSRFDFNVFFLLGQRLWVGGSYRTSVKLWDKGNLQSNLQATDAASLMVEIYATEHLRIGYAYDFTTSGLSNYQTGSHEISVGISFPTKSRRESITGPRYF